MKEMNLNELAKQAFENAKAKGFHDEKHTDGHYLMLVACELAEAVEADREGRRSDRRTYNFLLQEYGEQLAKYLFEMHIKDTVEDELADAVIRLLDFVGVKGYDIPENYITEEQIKNEADEVKEWMINKTFADVVFSSCLVNIESAKEIPEALMYYIFVVAELYGIDLIWHIKEKMMYNETRKMLHNNFVKSADMYFREFAGMIFNESTKMNMFADMESLDDAFRVWSKIPKEWEPKQTDKKE